MKTYTFDNFVPLQSNRFAFINAVATAAFPEKTGAPLYLYGRPGCGKTHLLHAISHYTHEFHPRIRQLLINANEFIEDFGNTRLGLGTADIRVAVPIDDGSLAAMASKAWRKNSYAFRTKYRDIDLLLIDDIQLLRYDEEARLQFFHTFNALHNKGKQIVITSNVPPQRLDGFEYRLRCRFEWGVIAEIKEPNTDDREKRRRTEAGMLDGPHTSLGERKSGPDVGLRNIEENESTTSVSPELVIGETAKYYEISEDDILGTERSRTAIKARQIAMYLSRELTDLKLWEIGRVFGGRDHTTPMHAIKKITGARAVEESVRHEIEDLIKIIKDANRNRSRDNG